jgi:hypothetical protein
MSAAGWTGDAVKVNISVSLALGSRRPGGIITPNDFRIGGSRACKLWCLLPDILPGKGSVSVDAAALESNVHLWGTKTNLTTTGSQTDPDGGTGATLLTESSDGGPTTHVAQENTSAAITSYADILVWIKKPSGGRNWVLCRDGGSSGQYLNQDGSSQAYNAGCTVTDMGADAGGRWFLLQWRDPTSKGNIRFLPADDTPAISYTGDGRDSMIVYMRSGAFLQPRASAWSDWSLDDAGDLNGHHLAQGTDAKQLLYSERFKKINGRAVPYGETGRAAFFTTDAADLVAIASGDDPVFAVSGVGSLDDDYLFRFIASGGVGNGYFRLESIGSLMYLVKRDASTTSSVPFDAGSGTVLNSDSHWALIGAPNRVWELWINGVSYGSVTLANLASITMADLQVCYSSAAGFNQMAEIAFFEGQVPGADAAARYATLKAQAGLSTMAARHGLSA